MSGFKLLDDISHPGTSEAGKRAALGQDDHLLGMTVHSMPHPEQALLQSKKRTIVGRWKMLSVILVCAAPVIASYFTYYVVRPEGRRNFGDLIEPQIPLPDLETVSISGKKEKMTALKGQWLLISVAAGACDETCSRHLYLQRQMREGLGKDKDRVDWIWLITDSAPVPDKLTPALKEATVLRVSPAGLKQWLKATGTHELSEHLFVVDPMGNWMMRFPANLDLSNATKAKRDLERLMRGSASWDQAGRVAPQSGK
jgi:hypothetical protein